MVKTALSNPNQLPASPYRQRGMSFVGFILIFAVVALFGLVLLRVFPSQMDAWAVKKILASMSVSEEVKTGTVKDIRDSFDRRAMVDNVNSIKGSDLEITKENNEVIVLAAWQQRVPLFGNYTLLIDYSMSTSDK